MIFGSFDPTPTSLFKISLVLGILIINLLLILFGWVTIRKVRLLNRTLKTDLAPILYLVTLLFFLISTGTLLLAIATWTKLFT